VSDRAELWLAVIAVATLTMALVQVSVVVYGLVLARRMARVVTEIEEQLSVLGESVNAIASDAARATSLAVAQVERVDRLFGELTAKIDETASTVQRFVITPFRDGAALLAALRAGIDLFREFSKKGSGGTQGRGDEDDGLFIG
jgi:hypothetical protein